MKWFDLTLDQQHFSLKFTRRAHKLYLNFHDAADVAIRQIREQFPGPLYLAFSGGIDSEYVANTLLRNKIDFVPIIVRTESTNNLEAWYAEYWCHQNQVAPIIINQSAKDCGAALIKYFPHMAKLQAFYQVQPLVVYNYARSKGGHCLYGAGDINLHQGRFYCSTIDFISDLVDVGYHPTSFFMYTPELALSYINQFDPSLDEQYNKLRFYGVSPRPKIDYHPVCYALPEVQKAMNFCFYDYKHTFSHKLDHWYGNKQDIMDLLLPVTDMKEVIE